MVPSPGLRPHPLDLPVPPFQRSPPGEVPQAGEARAGLQGRVDGARPEAAGAKAQLQEGGAGGGGQTGQDRAAHKGVVELVGERGGNFDQLSGKSPYISFECDNLLLKKHVGKDTFSLISLKKYACSVYHVLFSSFGE